ncbi:hypothetical protein ACFSM5_11280 [Lacibacterium aquatile]|uniref:Uncharacterized protein n=1 Tax=Lacibacterium aquatile TaxID=1168082 RepID=A0ABW5DQZ8_9PROT
MKSLITLLAAGISLAAISPAHAQAPWTEDATKPMQIGFKPDFAEAASFKPVVTVRRDGSERNTLQMGELSQPGPVAWITYQTAPRPIVYGGNAIDQITTNLLRGASFSRENRQTYSVETAFGSVEVIQAAGVLGDGSKRECAMWLETLGSGARGFWGYFCSGIDQPLDAGRVRAALSAVAPK